jgi:nucleotide-binding universal stress UspA family protein
MGDTPTPQKNSQAIEQTIVIALDASEQAEHAINWYIQRVHRPGNKLVFVHCIELPEMKINEQATAASTGGPGPRPRSLHMSPGVLAGMWKEEEAKVKQLEEKMKTLLKEKGLSGVLRTATGKPGEVICKIAEEENAVMIVTGTRGMGKVRRTILGSVSDFLVHHASCPVVVCRTRSRKPSGQEGKRSRHTSGEQIRALFHSFGKSSSRSQSVSSEPSDPETPAT